ncbi:ABC transporter permease [Haloquadratum walsbyi]|jgi:ABC-type multidrug transport system, permease component|uniref:ABC-type multidrug transport system, permease component n=1 Tax=Haloquadratum walsbyi J07HQW2 TaxID=1238425 RepID=U1PRU7_9EURY|nr:ABC transporter permease [Haloquadratum walsbyi]ERG96492.1 MAG: ABC-type multidrug transport system, permease component [Haloquadratum walsbyi J07HQW2]
MTRRSRIYAEFTAAWHAFIRRRTAVFFTFFFPAIIVIIFGALVQTQPTGGGLFAEPRAYYIAGYLSVVVLFTPLSRVGSTVARYRSGSRFEKLATTPLSRGEWLLAQSLVNVVVIGIAAGLLLILSVFVTNTTLPLGLTTVFILPFVALGVILFCGVGAIIGRIADSQDGVIAASNAIALPLLFLSETFVTPSLLPVWFRPALNLSPLTYVARGIRSVTYVDATTTPLINLGIVVVVSIIVFFAGTRAVPQTE